MINDFMQKGIDISKGIKDTLSNIPSDIQYIKNKNKEIKSIVKVANLKVEKERIYINDRFKELGERKIKMMGTTLYEFTSLFLLIKNMQFDSSEIDKSKVLTKELLYELKKETSSAKDIIKNVAFISQGPLAAYGLFGAVSLIGTASTGTVLGTLSGIAASNATLAWFGGGALAVGGGGMAIGSLVLGGIVILPAVSYFIWKGTFNFNKQRSKVDKDYAEANEFVQSVEVAVKKIEELKKLISNISKIIIEYNEICIELNKQTRNIIKHIGNDYSKYTDIQKSLIDKNRKFVMKLHKLINLSILEEDGSINESSKRSISLEYDFLKKVGKHEFIYFRKVWSFKHYLLAVFIIVDILITISFISNY